MTLLLVHLYVLSKLALVQQRTMVLHLWLIKPPHTRHCVIMPSSGRKTITPCVRGLASKPYCDHGLYTIICRGAHVWVPTRLSPCALLVSNALHWGSLVWPHPCHLVSPWVIYPPFPLSLLLVQHQVMELRPWLVIFMHKALCPCAKHLSSR